MFICFDSFIVLCLSDLCKRKRDAVKINGETYRITSSKNINVYIERSKINFDVEPIIIENRTMVPLRFLANAIGIRDNKIIYDETEQSVILEYNGKTIKLIVGDKNALIDIDEVELDVPAVELNNRVLVPLRFVCETFGYNVDYGETETSMNIFMKKETAPLICKNTKSALKPIHRFQGRFLFKPAFVLIIISIKNYYTGNKS